MIFRFLPLLCVSSLSACSAPFPSCLSVLARLVNLRWLSWIFRLTWLTSGVCSVGNSHFTLDGYGGGVDPCLCMRVGLQTTCPVLPQFIALHTDADVQPGTQTHGGDTQKHAAVAQKLLSCLLYLGRGLTSNLWGQECKIFVLFYCTAFIYNLLYTIIGNTDKHFILFSLNIIGRLDWISKLMCIRPNSVQTFATLCSDDITHYFHIITGHKCVEG